MQTKLKLFIIILTIVISFLNLSATLKAQTEQESLSISPSEIIITENDIGTEYEITLTNNTDKTYTATPTEIAVTRSAVGETLQIETEVESEKLIFASEAVTLSANSSSTITVRTKLDIEQSGEQYPALSFQIEEGGEQVDLNFELVSIFIVQNFNGNLDLTTDLSIDQNILNTNRVFTVNGKVINTGDKFFNPAGSVKVMKNGQMLAEKQITTQIEGLLFPEEEKEYNISWQNQLGIFQSIGTYTIETTINPLPYGTKTTTQVDLFYIPAQLIIAAAVVAIVVPTIGLISIVIKKRGKIAQTSK